LWCRKSKAFRKGPFALHRSQPEKGKRNVDIVLSGKISAEALVDYQFANQLKLTKATHLYKKRQIKKLFGLKQK